MNEDFRCPFCRAETKPFNEDILNSNIKGYKKVENTRDLIFVGLVINLKKRKNDRKNCLLSWL